MCCSARATKLAAQPTNLRTRAGPRRASRSIVKLHARSCKRPRLNSNRLCRRRTDPPGFTLGIAHSSLSVSNRIEGSRAPYDGTPAGSAAAGQHQDGTSAALPRRRQHKRRGAWPCEGRSSCPFRSLRDGAARPRLCRGAVHTRSARPRLSRCVIKVVTARPRCSRGVVNSRQSTP
jgi:hypothetical protein